MFWGVFVSQNATFRSQIADLKAAVLPYPEFLSCFTSMIIRLSLAESTVQKSTECALKSTNIDRKSTGCDRFASKCDRFGYVRARREF